MNSLIYLVRTQLKNTLRELVRKPGKLILTLLVLISLAGMVVLMAFTQSQVESTLPTEWLLGIFFAFLTLFLVISVQKGLTSGDAIFDMSDVNLLFVSPLTPQSILIYGLVRLAKVSFWAGFFILFQSNSLVHFGIDYSGVLVLFFVFFLSIMVLTMLSLVIYMLTNGNPRRKRLVRLVTAVLFIPAAAFFAVQAASSGDVLAALFATITSPWLHAVPLIGWAASGALALIQGQAAAAVFWLGLLLLSGFGMVVYLLKSRVDYYEDVLVATETIFERKRALEDGDVHAATASNAKVRVVKTGISGAGAGALFYKHLRETFRQSRFGFFGLSTIITFACILVAALAAKPYVELLTILQVLMWMQVFMIGNGHGLRELYGHTIYMIPEKPLKKMVFSNLEPVFKTLLESVLFFAVPGLILATTPYIIVGVMLAYTLFTLLLLGINYMFMRWTGANIAQGIFIMLYMLAVVLIVAPGLIPALIVGFSVGGALGTFLGLAILCAWQLAAALICFALSKNVLHSCDMMSMKPGK